MTRLLIPANKRFYFKMSLAQGTASNHFTTGLLQLKEWIFKSLVQRKVCVSEILSSELSRYKVRNIDNKYSGAIAANNDGGVN